MSGTRDRSTTIDRRLAGINYCAQPGTQAFRIDLPAAGAYALHLGIGDTGGSNGGPGFIIQDTTTTLKTCLDTTIVSPNHRDAQDTDYSDTNWPINEALVNLTFSTTIFRLKASTYVGHVNDTIQHIRLVSPDGYVPLDLAHTPQHQAILAM